MINESTLELAYNYLEEIEQYVAGTLTEERLNAMLVGMANDGIAHQLTGTLKTEFERRLADGRIQGVIQNAWDDMNQCVVESCYEKMYFDRETAELINCTRAGAEVAA